MTLSQDRGAYHK